MTQSRHEQKCREISTPDLPAAPARVRARNPHSPARSRRGLLPRLLCRHSLASDPALGIRGMAALHSDPDGDPTVDDLESRSGVVKPPIAAAPRGTSPGAAIRRIEMHPKDSLPRRKLHLPRPSRPRCPHRPPRRRARRHSWMHATKTCFQARATHTPTGLIESSSQDCAEHERADR